jgi:uncharacterized membrane protein YbhN (UPF0104 family)
VLGARGWARRLVVPVLLVAALVWGGVAAAGQVGGALQTVAAADVARLMVAALCETMSYVLLGVVLRTIAADRRLSYGDAIRAGLVTSGLGTILPAAPAEGIVLAARELEVRGVPRRRTFVAVGLAQWYFARALFALGAVATLCVASLSALGASDFDDRWPWLLGAGAILAATFLGMGVAVSRIHLVATLGRCAERVPFFRRRADRITASCRAWSAEIQAAVGTRGNRLRLLALAGGATAADAACFVYALRAAGVRSALTVLVVAYAIGMLGAFVPLLPAGLGVTETAVPVFLHHNHVALTVGLAGVLAYRVLATLMPALVGAGALAQLRLLRPRHRSVVDQLPR